MIPPPVQQNTTLYVGNLDKNVTENQIFDRFSRFGRITRFSIMRDRNKQESRGFAFIEFMNMKDAEAAKTNTNNERLGNKFIRVMWKGDHKKAPESANIFVSDIDPHATQGDLENAFQQYGPVLTTNLSVDEKTGTSNRYGQVQFKQEADAQKCLEDSRSRKIMVGEQPCKVDYFKSKTERDIIKQANQRNLYLRDLPREVTEDEINKIFGKFGTVQKLIVGKPADHPMAYALVAMNSRAEAEAALKALNGDEHAFKNQQKPFFITWHKSKHQLKEERNKERTQDRDKSIYMRNLKPEITKPELEQILKNLGATSEWMNLMQFEATENPTSAQKYKCQSVVIKMTSNDHVQIVLGHKEDKEIKKLFVAEKPFIDIAMPKADRERMKQIQHRNRLHQMPGMPAFQAPFMRMPPPFGAMYPPMWGMQMPPQQMRTGPPYPPRGGARGGPRGGRPMGGGQGRPQGGPRQGPPMGGYRGHPAQQQRPSQQPRPQQPEQPKKLDLEMIKKNLANFKSMKADEKRNILGELLYPKVLGQIGTHLAPKITGMLVDFEVMTEEEILDAIEDEGVLKQRITEAREALEEAEPAN
jgi:polyadenylate-binding protein